MTERVRFPFKGTVLFQFRSLPIPPPGLRFIHGGEHRWSPPRTNRREVDDRESSMSARRRSFLFVIPGFRLAEQLLVVEAAFRRALRRFRRPRVSDLSVEPEPEVYGRSLAVVHGVFLASIPFVFSNGLYPTGSVGRIGASLILLSDRHLHSCRNLSYISEKRSSMRNVLNTI